MASKIVYKVEFDKETKNAIKIKTEIDTWRVGLKESFSEVMDWGTRMSCYECDSKKLVQAEDKLKNLKTLIVDYGFKLTLSENEKEYTLVVHKPKCSISFSGKKEAGITGLLIQAEEWAEAMLEELNGAKTL